MAGALKDARRVQYNAADTPDPGLVADMIRMSAAADSLNGNVSGWDASRVTDMTRLVAGEMGSAKGKHELRIASECSEGATVTGATPTKTPVGLGGTGPDPAGREFPGTITVDVDRSNLAPGCWPLALPWRDTAADIISETPYSGDGTIRTGTLTSGRATFSSIQKAAATQRLSWAAGRPTAPASPGRAPGPARWGRGRRSSGSDQKK